MDNPLENLTLPATYIGRIRAFARDLAFGETESKHSGRFSMSQVINDFHWLDKKWKPQKTHENIPSISSLVAFGYLAEINDKEYRLTQKAFELLEKPLDPHNIFISYQRSESSALGVYIEARLKLVGNPNPFIDKNLEVGGIWHNALEEKIKECKYFILEVTQLKKTS